MCVSPNKLEDLEVACRKCWQCRAQRVKDYVGRASLEMLYNADAAFSVTLTYKGECTNAVVLQYRDVQLFLKRLRNDGYKVRYMVAGEYGGLKGRAHWHIVLFFRGKVPEIVPTWFEEPLLVTEENKKPRTGERVRKMDQVKLDANILVPWWGGSQLPNAGLTYWQKPDFKGLAYVMKYALKQEGTREKRWSVSKEPLLGYSGLVAMAKEYVRTGTVPNATYRIPSLRDSKGRLHRFKMTGKSKEVFLETFIDQWRLKYGTWPPVEPDTALANWFEKRFNTELKNPVQIINPDDQRIREWLKDRRKRQALAEYQTQGMYLEARILKQQAASDTQYERERLEYEFEKSETEQAEIIRQAAAYKGFKAERIDTLFEEGWTLDFEGDEEAFERDVEDFRHYRDFQ